MSVPLTKCLISVQESKKLLYGLLIAGGLFKAVGLLLYPSPLFPLLSHPKVIFFKQLLLSKTQLKCCDIFCEAAFYLGFLAACGQKAAAGLT